MKALEIGTIVSAVCTLIFVGITWGLTIPEGEFQGPINVYYLSIIALLSAAICAVLVCVRWRHQRPLGKTLRGFSVVVALFTLGFLVMFLADLIAPQGGGANIGLGLIGLAIHFFGAINAIVFLVSVALAKKRKVQAVPMQKQPV